MPRPDPAGASPGVRLDLVDNKILTGTIEGAQILELCEAMARVGLHGDLSPWQDVRLRLLEEHGAEVPGKITAR